MEVRDLRTEIGGQRLEVRVWRSEIGGQRLDVRDWRSEIGGHTMEEDNYLMKLYFKNEIRKTKFSIFLRGSVII